MTYRGTKIIKMNVRGHFCLYTPSECIDDKIALCVQGGDQAEDVPLFCASVSPSVHFTFPQSCPSAPCSGSVCCGPPVPGEQLFVGASESSNTS